MYNPKGATAFVITEFVKGEANEKQATHWVYFACDEYTSCGIEVYSLRSVCQTSSHSKICHQNKKEGILPSLN